MIRAAVLGSPISHSLSPTLHKRAYEILGVAGLYEAIEVSEVEFPQFMAEAISIDSKINWRGFSLTMPLKEIAANTLSEVDPVASRIASANTVIINRSQNDVNLQVISTDVSAFSNIFNRMELTQDCHVSVIGGGGTARAAIAALDGRVSRINIYQRSEKRNSVIANAALISELVFHDFSLLSDISRSVLAVSTVPKTASDFLLSSLPSKLKKEQTLFDVSYSPWPSASLSAWDIAGGSIIDGLELLIRQALEQIRMMTMVSFDFEEMHKALRMHAMEVINNA